MVLKARTGEGASSSKSDGGPGSKEERPIYYKEINEGKRISRFCLKPVDSIQPRGEKRPDCINVQVVKGKTTTFIHLDEDEAKKVRSHGDYVLKKIQRIHKSVIWNFVVGRSFADKIQRGKQASEEVNLDHDENSTFDPLSPKTWSDECIDFIGSLLKGGEFSFDGFVILFCVENDSAANNDNGVDYDEMAWELEKCLIYHYIGAKSQLIMNEEAVMGRKGLDPVSRKTKTPGKKKSGYCVYLAYQLLESVTQDQMVGEAINKCTDVNAKKKQLLSSLGDVRLMPQIDERLRKQIKELKEFMTRDQLRALFKLKEVKDQESLEMILQFLALLGKKDRNSMQGMMGLPQFLSFLNKDSTDHAPVSSSPRASSRLSSGNNNSPRGPTAAKSTLPRPTSGAGSRKPSIISATSSQLNYSMSSRSTTPDTPRKEVNANNAAARNPKLRPPRGSSLASIPDSPRSGSSTPETLKRVGPNTRRSLDQGMSSSAPNSARGPRKAAPPSRSAAESRSITPRRISSARSSINGDNSPSRLTPTSPRTGRTGRGRQPPTDGKMITREDLRRMNRSYPSPTTEAAKKEVKKYPPPSSAAAKKKKPPSAGSYSRTSIPMS